jgi:hypothetical protein
MSPLLDERLHHPGPMHTPMDDSVVITDEPTMDHSPVCTLPWNIIPQSCGCSEQESAICFCFDVAFLYRTISLMVSLMLSEFCPVRNRIEIR